VLRAPVAEGGVRSRRRSHRCARRTIVDGCDMVPGAIGKRIGRFKREQGPPMWRESGPTGIDSQMILVAAGALPMTTRWRDVGRVEAGGQVMAAVGLSDGALAISTESFAPSRRRPPLSLPVSRPGRCSGAMIIISEESAAKVRRHRSWSSGHQPSEGAGIRPGR